MRVKFKGLLVTTHTYHTLVLSRLLRIIDSRFMAKLNSVPLHHRNIETFADIAYEKDTTAIDACFKAAKKYPDLRPTIMMFAYPYMEDIQDNFGDAALNDPCFNVKHS